MSTEGILAAGAAAFLVIAAAALIIRRDLPRRVEAAAVAWFLACAAAHAGGLAWR